MTKSPLRAARLRRKAALGAGLAAAALAVTSSVVAPLPANAATVSYAALGDSYSAGVGTYIKVNSCFQSPLGYPALVATATGWSLNYQACISAKIADVLTKQLPTVAANTGVVSVSVGGNDLAPSGYNFTTVMEACSSATLQAQCAAALTYATAVLASPSGIPAALDTLFAAMRAAAPHAKKLAVGYPHLFDGRNCSPLTSFKPAVEAGINALIDQLDSVTQTEAAKYGVSFVDPRRAFAGHAWCDPIAYINGPTLPLENSFHPNVAGQLVFGGLLLASTGRLTTHSISAMAVKASAVSSRR